MTETVVNGRPIFVFDGEHRYEDGGFIINDRRQDLAQPEFNPLLVTTPHQSTIKDAMLRLINEAQDYLKICSFILDDRETLDALSRRAKSGDIALFVLTNLSKSVFERNLRKDADEDETESPSDRFNKHHEAIKKLVDAGAYVRASTESHAKFFISDHGRGILTSANLTYNSLNKNYESGTYLSALDAKYLERLFDIIFQKGTKYSGFERIGNERSVVERNSKLSKADFVELAQANIFWTYTKVTQSLRENLENIIEGAQTDLVLSTFSIVSLDKLSSLMKNLENFKKIRERKVLILTRANDARSDHVLACRTLSRLGCEVYGDLLNHSKGVIADSTYGL